MNFKVLRSNCVLSTEKIKKLNLELPNIYYSMESSIKNYDNYIRDTIRRDNSFVFEKIIKDNSERWFKTNEYIYKNIIFKKYIYFAMYFCIENESPKCKIVIDKLFGEVGLNKNQHKKNFIKYIKWKN